LRQNLIAEIDTFATVDIMMMDGAVVAYWLP